jgi:hypothetical protein
MKRFIDNDFSVYVSKSDLKRMEEQGDIGVGYREVPEEDIENYEYMQPYYFQPYVEINKNSYEVAFITK